MLTCKLCFNDFTEYACHSYDGLRCTACCPCVDKVNGDGPVFVEINGEELVWTLTHQLQETVMPSPVAEEPVGEVVLEDIVNDPTSPNFIGG